MKAERDYGAEYAADDGRSEMVDIGEMVHSTVDIPPDDYSAMVAAGIENPNAREYWAGYNNYIRNQRNSAEATIQEATSGAVC